MQLIDLRRPPVSINDPTHKADGLDALNGILGQLVGQTPTERKARLDDAVTSANDLSAFVRRKVPSNVTSKRRSSDSTTEKEGTKRAKVEESLPGS
jgi:HAT1-interacting factor 1